MVSWLLAGIFTVSAFAFAPVAANASPEGRKNTALLLGGGAVYALIKKKTVPGLVLGAAGLYAYKRYKDAKSEQKARRAYASGYRSASSRNSRRVVYYKNGHRYVKYRRA
jgi:uncharacterized membrane protein YebE (DUF533 family)